MSGLRMMYINERIQNMVRVRCEDDRRSFLRLDMNENPEGLPDSFVKRTCEKINGQLLATYPDKSRLIGLLARREGLESENIAVTNGSDEAIRSVFEVFTRAGSRVLMVTPSFEMYRIYGEMTGVALERIPYDESLSLPLETLKASITKETDLLILFNPNSPIGEAYTPSELRELLDTCRRTGTLAVIDEAYYPFGVSSAAVLIKEYDRLLVLRTFSKLYSLAGLRIGYALGNAEWIRCLNHSLGTYNVNTVGLLFAEELLKHPEMERELIRKEDAGRKYLIRQLEAAQYTYYAHSGNYVLIRPKSKPETVASRLRDKGILIKTYGAGILKDWIRVTTGDRSVMERFWREFCVCDGETANGAERSSVD